MKTTLKSSFLFPVSNTNGKVLHFASEFSFRKNFYTASERICPTVRSSKFDDFRDLKPVLEPQYLDFDIKPPDQSTLDVIIIGTGPAGLGLAEQLSKRGIRLCCVDPSPLSVWSNMYGVWAEDFQSVGLEDCLEATWHLSTLYLNDTKVRYLDRLYGKVNKKKLKAKLMQTCMCHGVTFYKAKVLKIHNREFDSWVECDDEKILKANLVIDATGQGRNFLEFDKLNNNYAYEVAYGILAEVENHPFDLDKIHLMDYRDSHLANNPHLRATNFKSPSFLYAMPLDSNLIFLEEAVLLVRPLVDPMELSTRLVARLRHLGIKVKTVLEEEKCVIPMGGPLPGISQGVMAFGAKAGMVHSTTGYSVARSMAWAPILAEAIAECLGSTGIVRGKPLYKKVWKALWPLEKRCMRVIESFGMETFLRLDLKSTTKFFDDFLELDPYYCHGYLSARLDLKDFVSMSKSMAGCISIPTMINLMRSSPLSLINMMGSIAKEIIQEMV